MVKILTLEPAPGRRQRPLEIKKGAATDSNCAFLLGFRCGSAGIIQNFAANSIRTAPDYSNASQLAMP